MQGWTPGTGRLPRQNQLLRRIGKVRGRGEGAALAGCRQGREEEKGRAEEVGNIQTENVAVIPKKDVKSG